MLWTQQEPWAAPFAVLPPFCNPCQVCLGPGGQQCAFTLYPQALYAINASSRYLFATCSRLLSCSAHPVQVSCAPAGELLWGRHPGVGLPVLGSCIELSQLACASAELSAPLYPPQSSVEELPFPPVSPALSWNDFSFLPRWGMWSSISVIWNCTALIPQETENLCLSLLSFVVNLLWVVLPYPLSFFYWSIGHFLTDL